MPGEVRELIRDLERAGSVNRGGTGSHRNCLHPRGGRITVIGLPATMPDAAKCAKSRELFAACDCRRVYFQVVAESSPTAARTVIS